MPITQRTSAIIRHSSHTGGVWTWLWLSRTRRTKKQVHRLYIQDDAALYTPHLFIQHHAYEIPSALSKKKPSLKATGLFRFTHFERSHTGTPPPAKTYMNTYSIGHGTSKNDTLKHKYQQWVSEAAGQSLLQLCLFTEVAAGTVMTQFKA